jgi:hypothetical protein
MIVPAMKKAGRKWVTTSSTPMQETTFSLTTRVWTWIPWLPYAWPTGHCSEVASESVQYSGPPRKHSVSGRESNQQIVYEASVVFSGKAL